MNGTKLIGICGSPQRPSRTRALVEAIVEAVGAQVEARSEILGVDEVWPVIGIAPLRAALPPEGEAIIRAIETVDLLVVGTPVYRASYTGALKHIFDLVDQVSLLRKPVILSATGRFGGASFCRLPVLEYTSHNQDKMGPHGRGADRRDRGNRAYCQ